MAEYRRKNGSDTWHWCRNCSNDPKSGYDVRNTRPSYDLCNQCLGKERNNECSG